MTKLNLDKIDSSWMPYVKKALTTMDQSYLTELEQSDKWLPGSYNIFNAFQLPLEQTRYILFGESPYPRPDSAIGYAFWDGAVHELWSDKGLTKPVNRATSLRNIIKTLLVARGDLDKADTSQQAIHAVNKAGLVNTIDGLFQNFLDKGIMLLNASPVLSQNAVKKDAKHWHVFMKVLLEQLCESRPDIKLILWGKIAKEIESISAASCFKQFHAEHPYNLSFISNDKVLEFLQPLDLLKA